MDILRNRQGTNQARFVQMKFDGSRFAVLTKDKLAVMQGPKKKGSWPSPRKHTPLEGRPTPIADNDEEEEGKHQHHHISTSLQKRGVVAKGLHQHDVRSIGIFGGIFQQQIMYLAPSHPHKYKPCGTHWISFMQP